MLVSDVQKHVGRVVEGFRALETLPRGVVLVFLNFSAVGIKNESLPIFDHLSVPNTTVGNVIYAEDALHVRERFLDRLEVTVILLQDVPC